MGTICFVLLAWGALTGCGPGGPVHCNLGAHVQRPPRCAVIFLVDGLAPRSVEKGCLDGRLPNIQKRFCDRGATVRYATTPVPAITYAAIGTLLTGTAPATHGVIGNRWCEPPDGLFRTYVTMQHYDDINGDCTTPTLYELIRPAESVSVQNALCRGVTHNFSNWAASGVMWFFADYTAVDKLTATSISQVADWANWHGRWPAVVTLYFPGLDSIEHRFGVSSAKFEWSLVHTDHQIGRVCDWLETQGLLDTTYLVLVSDHGMIDVKPDGHINLLRLLTETWGRNATDEMRQDGPAEQRQAFYDRFDTIVNDQDGRRASLHFRGSEGWDTPPAPADVQAILETPPPQFRLWMHPGVALVTYLSDDHTAVLRSGWGVARIVERPGPAGPEYAYIPEPDDVLVYRVWPQVAEFVAAGFHTSREWLDLTADQRVPDLVPHLIPLLRLRPSGQALLFARPGYSFADEHGGHGGIDRDERLMTFMVTGPGIAPGTVIPTARAADLVPTLLDLLAVPHPADDHLEGVSLLEAGLLTSDAQCATPR